jgi:hypothetical protein
MELREYEQRKFMIFTISELSLIDFTQIHETSEDTVRRSIDGTLTFVKWDNDIPQCITDLKSKQGPYTYEEILEILSTPEWTINQTT